MQNNGYIDPLEIFWELINRSPALLSASSWHTLNQSDDGVFQVGCYECHLRSCPLSNNQFREYGTREIWDFTFQIFCPLGINSPSAWSLITPVPLVCIRMGLNVAVTERALSPSSIAFVSGKSSASAAFTTMSAWAARFWIFSRSSWEPWTTHAMPIARTASMSFWLRTKAVTEKWGWAPRMALRTEPIHPIILNMNQLYNKRLTSNISRGSQNEEIWRRHTSGRRIRIDAWKREVVTCSFFHKSLYG